MPSENGKLFYELVGYSTDSRSDDVRYRSYTTSARKAALFRMIPKIQFTDSGHGIVFSAREVDPRAQRKPVVRALTEYVSEQLTILSHGRFP